MRLPPGFAEDRRAAEPKVIFRVLTAFPDLLGGMSSDGVVRIALERGLIGLEIVNLRDYAEDRHRSVDDYPYGGGPGMILKVGPVWRALEALPEPKMPREVILLSPQGRRLDQTFLEDRARGGEYVFVCARYKGVDERIRQFVDIEVSLGDFVIAGGELAAMVIIEGISRLIPGVLGDLDSALGDSFSSGILDCAYYTRPENFRGLSVPEVLLSGNHEAIRGWRRQNALLRTLERRPDLLEKARLSEEDLSFLERHGWRPKADRERGHSDA